MPVDHAQKNFHAAFALPGKIVVNSGQLFEQACPDIKVHVNNVGGGPAEYQKLQTAIKAASAGPNTA